MLRAITGRSDDEAGLTVVELLVTLVVMGVIVSAVLSVLFSAYKETGVVLNRRDVLADGQFAMQQMTKQFRQASAINERSPTLLDVNTYVDGEARRIAWRTSGASAPYALETQVDDGGWRTVLTFLGDANIFTYPPTQDGVDDQVVITLPLQTSTTTVAIASEVQMRNV